MKNRVHLSFRMLAVVLSVALVFGVIGVVFASSANAVLIDGFTTGADSIVQTPPDNNAVTLVGSSAASASGALGTWRTAVFTTTFIANSLNKYSTYNVNTGARTLGISAPSGGTPYAYIKWDGTNSPTTLTPSGLGSVDLISGTNTGFVIEFKQEDLPATLAIRVYSGANSSVYTVSMPGGVVAGSHVDYFIPFDNFQTESGTGASFTSVGAIVWNLIGADSLDFEVTNYETDRVWDLGDVPDSYGTTLAASGPRHLVNFLRLGNNVDAEPDGQPTFSALGDDNDGNAPYLPGDEEGVTRGSRLFASDGYPPQNWRPGAVFSGLGGSVNVTVLGPCTSSANCHLRGWVDWNANGVFESSEVIITGTGTWNGEFVGPAANVSKYFDIPASPACFDGTCYARFRLCGGVGGTTDCDSPNGLSTTGEVEDYAWVFGPNAVTLNSLQAQPVNTSPVLPVALVGGAAVILIGAVLFTRKSRKQSV